MRLGILELEGTYSAWRLEEAFWRGRKGDGRLSFLMFSVFSLILGHRHRITQVSQQGEQIKRDVLC